MLRRLVPKVSKEFGLLWILLTLLPSVHHAFTVSSKAVRHEQQRSYSTVQYTFWKGLFDSAFENDPSLSTVDQRKGMLEGPNSSDNDNDIKNDNDNINYEHNDYDMNNVNNSINNSDLGRKFFSFL